MSANQQSIAIGRKDGDNIIFSQSWWNQFPLLCGFIIISILLGYASFAMLPQTIISFNFNGIEVIVPLLLIVPFILLLKAAYRIYNRRFVLTPEYMIHITGRISWREHSVRLEYSRIQEIQIDQTILQRVFGLGDVVIMPIAGTAETAVLMHGVSSPRLVKDLIRQRQNAPTD